MKRKRTSNLAQLVVLRNELKQGWIKINTLPDFLMVKDKEIKFVYAKKNNRVLDADELFTKTLLENAGLHVEVLRPEGKLYLKLKALWDTGSRREGTSPRQLRKKYFGQME